MARLRSVLRPLGQGTLAPAKHLPATPIRPSSTFASDLKKTPLYDLHVAHGGKMVPFAEYSMPVEYASHSVFDSHRFTREHASLFDVSHMVQHTFTGRGAADALAWLSPTNAPKMPVGKAQLSALLRDTGGIVDDCMITRVGHDRFHVVTNAACRAKDVAFIAQELAGRRGVDWSIEERAGMLALQGPGAAALLRAVVRGFETKFLFYGSAAYGQIKLRDGTRSRDVLVSRGGYTGEDGFEISLVLGQEKTPEDVARELTAIAETLLDTAGPEKLRLAGLGARDSLRIEAGMCLYGQDIDEGTTPVEAGLSFIIPKERRIIPEERRIIPEERRIIPEERRKFMSPKEMREEGGFSGAEVVLPQLVPQYEGGKGVGRQRVGLLVRGAPAREGAEIVTEGEKLGVVTSGCPSPTLNTNIAMGYVKTGWHEVGTEVKVVVGGKRRAAMVTKIPFVLSRNYREVGYLAGREAFRREKEARRAQHEADTAYYTAQKKMRKAKHEAEVAYHAAKAQRKAQDKGST